MPGTALSLSFSLDAWHGLFLVDEFICLPLSPGLDALARLSGRTSLHLLPVVDAWPLWVVGFICLPLSPRLSGVRADNSFVLSRMPGTAPWVEGFICGVFRGHACVLEAQKRVFDRAHALDQATVSMLRMHA